MPNPHVFDPIPPQAGQTDWLYKDGQSTTTSRLNFPIENTRYLKYALDALGLTGTGQLTATYLLPLVLVVGSNYAALWIDFTDTANPIIRVKFGIGAVPVPSAIDDPAAFIIQLAAPGPANPTF